MTPTVSGRSRDGRTWSLVMSLSQSSAASATVPTGDLNLAEVTVHFFKKGVYKADIMSYI